jgi:Lipocalin-like domain
LRPGLIVRLGALSSFGGSMNRRDVISALSLVPFASAKTNGTSVRKKFIGVWKLISGESKDEGTGEVRYPWGKNPVGRLTYDDAGRVFAQLMNPGRRSVGGMANRGAAAAIATASAEDMREMLTGFNAYFGTFDVDEPSRTVTHHLQSALIPSWVGTDQRRKYEFSGSNRLIMFNTASNASYRLVWHRDDK